MIEIYRRKLIWTIKNFRRSSVAKYGRDERTEIKPSDVFLNGEVGKCEFLFYPNIDGKCWLKIIPSNFSFNIMAQCEVWILDSEEREEHLENSQYCFSNLMPDIEIESHDRFFANGSKLLKNNMLRLTVMLQLRVGIKNEKEEDTQFNMANSKYFNSKTFSDLTIVCRDGRKIPVHKFVIADHEFFNAKLIHGVKKIEIEDFDGDVMLEVVRFLYTEKVENMDQHAAKLLEAADKFELKKLKAWCIDHFLDNLWIVQAPGTSTAIDTLILAAKYNEPDLYNECMKMINENYFQLRKTDDWRKLNSIHLSNIMDYIKMDEWFVVSSL